MMLAVLLLFFPQFDGLTKNSRVAILPVTGLILTSEPNQTNVTIYNLEGQKIKKLELNALPGAICEANGQVLITTYEKNGTTELWNLSSNLVHIRRKKGICFDSPNIINGSLYAYDVNRHRTNQSPFPQTIQKFNLSTLKYEGPSILKIPSEIQKEKMLGQRFWVFDWDSVYLIFFQYSMNVFLYTDQYFVRESLEHESIKPEPVKFIPFLPDRDVKNSGPFKLETVMREDIADAARIAWYQNKTIIFTVWAKDDSIFIAYGESAASKTSLGIFTKSLDFQSIQEVDGKIFAGKDRFAWVYKITNEIPSITKISL